MDTSIAPCIELETPRLRLRRWRPEDRAPFADLNNEPSVLRHLSPLTREGLDAMLDRIDAHFAQHGWGSWAVEERTSGTLIGLCGLSAPAVEIGWRLSTHWQGQGLAREAAETCLDFAFAALGLDRVVSFTVPANRASWGLMERLGMTRIAEFDHPSLPPEGFLAIHG